MITEAIILAAGMGERLKAGTPKGMVLLLGEFLFVHSARVFQSVEAVRSVILVVPPGHREAFETSVRDKGFEKITRVIDGGKRRRDSVAAALEFLEKDTDLVAIHDGARPLVTVEVLTGTIRAAAKHGAAITGVPVRSTIKEVDRAMMTVRSTPSRDSLWEIQTPQVFRKEWLREAHARFEHDREATDDSMMVEALGHTVHVVRGSPDNLKVTTAGDLALAEALLKQRKK